MSVPFTAIDHVQLAMPAGGEPSARAFFGGVLGMEELQKPEPLRARGGVWFSSGSVQLHVGVDPDFRPAKKAHVALTCADLAALAERLHAAGIATSRGIPSAAGTTNLYIDDPFGNRIELIGAATKSRSASDEPSPPAAGT